MLQHKSRQKLEAWQTKVRSHSGACKWVKMTEVGSPVLKDEAGLVLTSRPRTLAALRAFWSRTFGNSATNSWDQFAAEFHDHFPTPASMNSLPPITGADILMTAKKMKDKAGGPDGLLPRHIMLLPEAALDRLAMLYNQCEHIGKWPAQVHHWKVVFLSKTTAQQGSVALAAGERTKRVRVQGGAPPRGGSAH